MKRLCALAFALAAATASGSADENRDARPFSVTLQPGKVHEECLRLDADEKRKYYWKADAPVDFNIHYHQQTEVFYPMKRDGMRTDGGTFAAKSGQDYCWMWTARDKPAKVQGRIEAR